MPFLLFFLTKVYEIVFQTTFRSPFEISVTALCHSLHRYSKWKKIYDFKHYMCAWNHIFERLKGVRTTKIYISCYAPFNLILPSSFFSFISLLLIIFQESFFLFFFFLMREKYLFFSFSLYFQTRKHPLNHGAALSSISHL